MCGKIRSKLKGVDVLLLSRVSRRVIIGIAFGAEAKAHPDAAQSPMANALPVKPAIAAGPESQQPEKSPGGRTKWRRGCASQQNGSRES